MVCVKEDGLAACEHGHVSATGDGTAALGVDEADVCLVEAGGHGIAIVVFKSPHMAVGAGLPGLCDDCLLYTSDAADE